MANSLERWIENRQLVNPLRESFRLETAFNKLFNDMISAQGKSEIQKDDFAPSCEILETDAKYIMKFDMPGISKEQLNVEVNKDVISIQAERMEDANKIKAKQLLTEIAYGNYQRSFILPEPIDDKKIEAKFKDGVLTVTILKVNAIASKQIPIH
ncbi:MAG: Hsp20/alpha crystallin family protein [Pseudobdellovibrio sp.]